MHGFTWSDKDWIGLMIFKILRMRTGLRLKKSTVRSSLVGLSNHSAFHWWSAQCVARQRRAVCHILWSKSSPGYF